MIRCKYTDLLLIDNLQTQFYSYLYQLMMHLSLLTLQFASEKLLCTSLSLSYPLFIVILMQPP